MKPFLLLALIVFACGGCTTTTQNCRNEAVCFRLTGFSKEEADTVIIRKFHTQSGEPAEDSMVYLSADAAQGNPAFHYDTLLIPNALLVDSLGISVRIPGAGRTVLITGLISEPPHSETYKTPFFTACTGKPGECYNRLLSYEIGDVKATGSGGTGSVTIDISK